MTIKVLESTYQHWIDIDKKLARIRGGAYKSAEQLRDYHDRVEPVFNRPGLYYDSAKQVTWEEVLIDGEIEAFITTSVKQFKYDLYRLNLEELPYSIQLLNTLYRQTRNLRLIIKLDSSNTYANWLADLFTFRTQTRELSLNKQRARKRILTMRGAHANR